MRTLTLNNGVEMPLIGYGVFQIAPNECEQHVLDAIRAGYRSIDTAQAYYNEEGVGNAVRRSGVPREQLFLTTKVWISNAGDEGRHEALMNRSANFRPITSTCCSSISLSAIITVHTVLWNGRTRLGKSVPSG